MSDNNEKELEQLRRWRLILGGQSGGSEASGAGTASAGSSGSSEEKGDGTGHKLVGGDATMDQLLAQLYEDGLKGGEQKKRGRRGGMNKSNPSISRWLGDIRDYFPKSVVQVMQKDAIEQVGIEQMLGEPDIMDMIEPDVQLVATLVSLHRLLPNETRATARIVVQKVVDELKRKLTNRMRQAVMGALNRAVRNNRPRHNEINWKRTIELNLKHYQPEYKTIIPERLVGYGRKQSSLKDVILCIDQSGSMATSVVYASIFGAVMASLPALKTHMVLFDTSVVDMTAELSDPVELLFGTQLGGGTNINRAMAYCEQLVVRPQDTVLVLVSDLYEGGNASEMLERVERMVKNGVQMVALLALNDEGTPSFSRDVAAKLSDLDVPSFSCTPDEFPDLMATVLNKGSLEKWM